MADDLRTRIAQALQNMDGDITFESMADAVIRELNLQPETLCTSGGAILSRLDGKVLADNRRMTRWATPWECDESPVK